MWHIQISWRTWPFSRTRPSLCAPNVKVMSLPFSKEKRSWDRPGDTREGVRRNNELSLLRQAECQSHRLLFQPTHLVGYDTRFSSDFLVCFLSCPPLQSGLQWCLLLCKALFQAAYLRSADINGKDLPEFSRNAAGGAGVVMSHGACMPLGTQATTDGVCSFLFCSGSLSSSSMRQELGGFISTCIYLWSRPSASSYLQEERSGGIVQARLKGQFSVGTALRTLPRDLWVCTMSFRAWGFYF